MCKNPTTIESKVGVNSLQRLFSKGARGGFNSFSAKVFGDISECHSPSKGYHLYGCDTCGHQQMQYHSCGNRHCIFCGSMKREAWVENRMSEVLPTSYYHVVFTLPHELNSLILGNRRTLFKLLFDSSSESLLKFGQNEEFLGADVGITSVLHTWGQDLSFHPHIHCIVTGGGFDGKNWKVAKRAKGNFLFPIAGLRTVFKAIFLKGLRANAELNLGEIDLLKLIEQVGKKKWNVYAKAPFSGASSVVEYVGRYSHKIAISRHRIVGLTEQTITFNYKDYADNNKQKQMVLSHEEFLRRFEQHILPKYFVKIRHYGFLQNHGKHQRLLLIQQQLSLVPQAKVAKKTVGERLLKKYGTDISICPCCGEGKMIFYGTYYSDNKRVMKDNDWGVRSFEARNKASPQES